MIFTGSCHVLSQDSRSPGTNGTRRYWAKAKAPFVAERSRRFPVGGFFRLLLLRAEKAHLLAQQFHFLRQFHIVSSERNQA
jgi:hypothetical protein